MKQSIYKREHYSQNLGFKGWDGWMEEIKNLNTHTETINLVMV